MTIDEAIKALRGWRLKPPAVGIILAEYERLRREEQERHGKP